jgi:hypothetical protein
MNQAQTITKQAVDENCGFRRISTGILARLAKTSVGARGSQEARGDRLGAHLAML